MKIAVTGANGHVGANLCRELIRQGHEVKALIYHDDHALQGLKLEQIKGDVLNPDSLLKLCEDAEVVFHLAALISVNGEKEQLERINIRGTQNLLEAILKTNVRRLIHFSSIHALNHFPLDLPMDESRNLTENASMQYEATKAKADHLVHHYMEKGLDAIVMNPTAILGPYDYKPSLMGQVLLRLYKGTLPALVPGGYDWVDVRDIVQACIAAMTKGKSRERYILSGGWLSVKDLARMLEEVTGKKIVRTMIPMSMARIGVPFIRLYSAITGQHPLYTYQSLQVLMEGNRLITNGKARKELDFNPRPLQQTLADSITWFKDNNFLK